MSMREGRETLLSDAPNWLRWGMGFIERIGFPIAVAVYCGYLLIKVIPENTKALLQIGLVMTKIDENLTEKSDFSHNEYGEIIERLRRRR